MLFRSKPGGLGVDTIGIAPQLKEALATYTAANGKGRPTHDTGEAVRLVRETLQVVRDLLHPLDWSGFQEPKTALALLQPCLDHILALSDGKKRFCDVVLAMAKAYSLCSTTEEGAALDPALEALLPGLEEALIRINDSAHELTRYLDGLESDPRRQEELEQRLAALESLARKHRIATDDLPAKFLELAAELAHASRRGRHPLPAAGQCAGKHFGAVGRAVVDEDGGADGQGAVTGDRRNRFLLLAAILPIRQHAALDEQMRRCKAGLGVAERGAAQVDDHALGAALLQ